MFEVINGIYDIKTIDNEPIGQNNIYITYIECLQQPYFSLSFSKK